MWQNKPPSGAWFLHISLAMRLIQVLLVAAFTAICEAEPFGCDGRCDGSDSEALQEAESLRTELLQTKMKLNRGGEDVPEESLHDLQSESFQAFSQQREQLRRQNEAMAAETAAQNGKALKPEPTGEKEGGKNATATKKRPGHSSNQNDKLVQEAMIPLGAFAVGLLLFLFQQIVPAVLAVYFGAQAGFSLYMKVVLSNTTISQELNIDGIPAGFLVTAIQQVVAFVVLLVVVAVLYVTPYRYTPRRLNTWSEVFCVLLFSLAFSANIGLNNFSLSLLAVSLNMIIRSCLPLVTLIFQQILGPCVPALATSVRVAEVVLMVAGVVFAGLATVAKSHGSHSSESKHLGLGVFVCSLSDVACAVNLILASVFGSVLKPALNPVDTIFYMAVPCAICLIPASIWVYHPVDWPGFGELSDTQVLKKVMELSPNTVLWVVLSGVIAAGYNVLQYTVVQKLSASHAAFAGNFNKAATILLSICMGLESLPGGFWTAVMLSAIIGNIGAFTSYSMLKSNEKALKRAESESAAAKS